MELNWLQSLFYGFLSGLTEFLPVSAEAHRCLYLALLGMPAEESGLLLASRLGSLAAVFFCTLPLITKLSREHSAYGAARQRRSRQPDSRSIASLQLLKTAVFPVLLGLVLLRFVAPVSQRLWLLALMMVINGIVLYIPQHLPSGNKDSLSLNTTDALLIGLAGIAGVVPGVSRLGMMSSVAEMRGADRRYSLDMCLVLCLPVLLALSVLDGFAVLTAGGLTFLSILRYLCSAAASFGGAYLSIFTMRSISFKSGYSGFAYYCWGLALSTFILFLMI